MLLGLTLPASAQFNYEYAFDNLPLFQTEMRGTSRYMSMGGAFAALGGDLSALNKNPGGIGVYRTGDLGFTFSLDLNSSKSSSVTENRTKGTINNFGYAGVIKLPSETMPNLNWGITYSRVASFDRRYRNVLLGMPTSMTNTLADIMTDSENATHANMTRKDPYWGDNAAAWNQVLAYNNYLALPTNYEGTHFAGLGFTGVTVDGEYDVSEKGHTDEFSFNLGGNIANTLYWGLGVGVTDLVFEQTKYYGESLWNTEVYTRPDDPSAVLTDGNCDFGFTNFTRTTGTGVNFKLGVILRPVNEFRIGLAFHTPTYYDMHQRGWVELNTAFAPKDHEVYKLNDSSPEYAEKYNISTPWRFIGGIAGVIGTKAILSADYEYVANDALRLKQNYGYGKEEVKATTDDVKSYFSPNHIIRVGGEYRINPSWSLRAGYSYETSSVKQDVRDGKEVTTSGSSTSYGYDRSTQYITAGLGYKYRNFYLDLAYVYKYRLNDYHLFTAYGDLPTVYDEVKDQNHRISATIGFRF